VNGVDGRPGAVASWVLAARPRTLPVAVAPVLAGSALAWAEAGRFAIDVFVVALLVALLIQIATNLHNDAADTHRGADNPATRVGPARASAQGWLPAGRVQRVAIVLFLVAFCCGLYLVRVGGWEILALGILCIFAGAAYSGGPWPVAYTCFGELFVWLFFGLAAVGGTYYLQAGGQLSGAAILAGATLGLPAAAILVVNNTRDVDDDRRAGRRTFPVLFGRRASGLEYALLMLVALPLSLRLVWPYRPWGWLVLLAVPWATVLVRRFFVARSGADFNALLAATAQFHVGLAGFLSLGLALAAAGGAS
jgi:1,4-dihydroxy-2-naphthoate octaprenyltransferase